MASNRRRLHRMIRIPAMAVTAALIATITSTAPAARAAAVGTAPSIQHDKVVPGHTVGAVSPTTASKNSAVKPFTAVAPAWPTAAVADVTLAVPSGAVALATTATAGAIAAPTGPVTGPAVRVGTAPVWLSASVPGSSSRAPNVGAAQAGPEYRTVHVQVFDHQSTAQAGVSGLLLALSRTDDGIGSASDQVSVDYTGFRTAYGADWASRLRLVELTGCAATTPVPSGCRQTALPTTNDVSNGRLSAAVTLPSGAQASSAVSAASASSSGPVVTKSSAVFLAAQSGASGGSGSFSASSLSSSGTWTAGGSSGDFDWTYALRTPPAVGGAAPSLALSYSSQAVDGETATTNNQPSWVGEGFAFDAGYIERRYKTCSDDMGGSANNTVATADLCWATDNATLSMAGHAGELIKDASDPNRWHLRGDDGTYIRHLTGANNGALNGEWWVVHTTDGSQFWFGGTPASNSTLAVPVFGNNPGEPCHASTFAASSCTQAWRWNLDHVVDPSGNTMTYFYTKETNHYARNQTPTDAAAYDRGAYLTRIEYGTRDDMPATAPMRVSFTTDDRCLASCATHDAAHWPDTPWDQDCQASPCIVDGPTFWTTKRLTAVTTELWSGNGTTYNPVTTWTFTHTFPDPGDGTRAGLWLSGITQTGHVGTTTAVPPITFTPVQLANRVAPAVGLPPMNWMRMAQINTETGGQIQVTYAPTNCVSGGTMPDPAHLENNTLRCFPVKWTPPGAGAQITDFFNKYVVAQVNSADLVTSGNPTTTVSYEYIGPAAWHYADDDGLITSAQKTWSVWRGYGDVKVHTGVGADETITESTYFRGMNGDQLPGGATRTVQLPAIDMNLDGNTTDAGVDVPVVNDEDAFAGVTRQTFTYNGATEVSSQANEPWESAPTATRTIDGVTVNARFTGVQASHTRTDLDGGRAPRTTSSRTVYDAYGMPIQHWNNGDDAVTGDESCGLIDYGRNTAADGSVWLVDFPYRQRSFATDCTRATTQSGLTSADVSADTVTFYDGSSTVGAPPTRGLATRVDTLKDWVSGAPVYQTSSTTGYDANGRTASVTDVRGNTTTTTYSNKAGGQVVGTTTTNQLGWATTSTLEPAFGTALSITDPNGRVTSQTYDGLGRLTGVWKPGRDKATQSANSTYSYLIRNNAPSVVTTSTLTPSGGYATSYTLYDGLLRSRQTQGPRGDGTAGALVADTFYDTPGRAWKTYSPYLAAITPGTNLFVANQQSDVPARTETLFDSAGRVTASVTYVNSSGVPTEFARTTTAYGGDRVDVTPPTGGTASSAIVDALGNTTEVRQYHGPTPTPFVAGSYDSTIHTYNRKTQQTRVTDSAGNHWDYTYDLLGRVTQISNPNSGTITTSYNAVGDIQSTTDARNVTLVNTYDSLGRKTGLYQGTVTPANQLAAWTYDGLTNSRGQLTKTTRYDSGNAYTVSTLGLTADYQPTAVSYGIPAAETGLAGTYAYVYTYNVDGSPNTTRVPTIDGGALGTETLTQGYTSLGQPASLSTSIPTATTLVPSIAYTGYGELAQLTLQTNGGNAAYQTYTYAAGTRRLVEQQSSRQTAPTTLADQHYTYDTAGNLIQASDTPNNDNQCYSYDYLDRLTSAWTPTSGDCTAAKNVAALGGPAPYWTDWTFNSSGTRATQTEHLTTAGTRLTTYATPAAGSLQPHTLTGTTVQDTTGTRTASYGYDAAGNVSSRPDPAGTGTQTLTWSPEGHLATVTDAGQTTSYLYSVDGARLIARDGTGKTLYLPGQELRYTTATGSKATTRYYGEGGQTIAMRTAGGLTWLLGDRQGTTSITVDAATQNYAMRRQDPYGNSRGSVTGTWPAAMNKGYLGGTEDPTGLTHLGAREYDPVVGRFISPDLVCDPKDPQGLDGYAYAHQNPIGRTDPTGLDSGSGWQYVGETHYSYDAGGYHYNIVIYHFLYCTNDMTQCLGGFGYIDSNGKSHVHEGYWWSASCYNDSGCVGGVFDKASGGDWVVGATWIYGLDLTSITVTPLCVAPPTVTNSGGGIGPAPDGSHGCNLGDWNCLFHNPGAYFMKNGADILTAGVVLAGGTACILVSFGACTPALIAAGGMMAIDQYADHGRFEPNGVTDLAFNLALSATPFGAEDHIALGLTENVGAFADSVGARTLMAQAPGEWQASMSFGAYNAGTRFSVTLDGVEDIGNSLVRGKYREAGVNALVGGRTPSWLDWEMYILNQANAWDRVTFYQDGNVVANPFK